MKAFLKVNSCLHLILPTDEGKSDSILVETVGTRHITNKIVEEVFTRPLEGIPCVPHVSHKFNVYYGLVNV